MDIEELWNKLTNSSPPIEGEKRNYQGRELNLSEMTCSCEDFKYRRSLYPVKDKRRYCKHLKDYLIRYKDTIDNYLIKDLLINGVFIFEEKEKEYSKDSINKVKDSLRNIINKENIIEYSFIKDFSLNDINIIILSKNPFEKTLFSKIKFLFGIYRFEELTDNSIAFSYEGIPVSIKRIDNEESFLLKKILNLFDEDKTQKIIQLFREKGLEISESGVFCKSKRINFE